MLEAGAMNLASLPPTKQAELLELLFGASGASFSALKTTMLGNDFSTATHGKWTTYDDTAEDLTLDDFSIERDLHPNGTLSFLKRALRAGFSGTIQAYMDYPPDWMLTGALPDNATVRPECYETLARYMAKYVQAYAAHGVHISFVEAFNEPTDSYTKMSAEQLATFLGRHAGPLFEKLGLWPRTKLTYGGQCSRASAGKLIPVVMADQSAAKYIDVLAVRVAFLDPTRCSPRIARDAFRDPTCYPCGSRAQLRTRCTVLLAPSHGCPPLRAPPRSITATTASTRMMARVTTSASGTT